MQDTPPAAEEVARPRLLVTPFRSPRKDTFPSGVCQSPSPERCWALHGVRVVLISPRTIGFLPRGLSWLLLLGLMFGLGAEVSAHAVLVESDPVHGAVLDESPPRVLLRFNAAIEQAVTRVDLLDVNKASTPLRTVESSIDRVIVALPRLSPGVYTVAYKVLARDGHVTEGFIRFTIRGR